MIIIDLFKKIRRKYNIKKYKLRQKYIKLNQGLSAVNLNGCQYMEIGNNCIFGKYSKIDCISSYANNEYNPRLVIGNSVFINDFFMLLCADSIKIGNDTMIAHNVLITDLNHGYYDSTKPYHSQELITKPVIIGKNVWIGAYATILPGVTIGDNSIIGAHAVVTKDVPSNTIVCGNPAKVVKNIASLSTSVVGN